MKSRIRKIIRLALLGYLLTGVALTAATGLVAGCAAVPGKTALPAATPATSPLASLEDAIAAKHNAVLREHAAIWEREQNAARRDDFTAALAAYRIGSASDDYRWSLLSVRLFDAVLDRNPDFALARAWRGSANAVYAGDYPVKGIFLAIPGPGFVRLEYVRRGKRDLNAAVEAAPDDPVVRIIRASTFIAMPKIFGGTETGIADFALLEGWTNDPQSNPQNADLLASRAWRKQYFLNRARAMAEIGDSDEADKAWRNLLRVTDDPADRELAQWHLK